MGGTGPVLKISLAGGTQAYTVHLLNEGQSIICVPGEGKSNQTGDQWNSLSHICAPIDYYNPKELPEHKDSQLASLSHYFMFTSYRPIHKTAGSGKAMEQPIDLVMAPSGYHIISYCRPLCPH